MSTKVDERDSRRAAALGRYWKRNATIMAVLLFIWAVVGLGAGVLFADVLNVYSLGGYPLGFWFAQQGSILVFVLLILVYALVMNRLDKQHHRELQSTDVITPKRSGRFHEAGASVE